MLYEKKNFGNPQNGGGDFDSAFYSVGPNNWINGSNIRTLTTDFGETNTVESIGANVLKNNPFLSPGVNIFIGGAVDEANGRFVTFVWNESGLGGIYAYMVNTEAWFIVLLESDVIGGFNWEKNRYIHSARIINKCVYWTDYFNEPRRVDIEAGIKLYDPSFDTKELPYSTPISQSVISIIRRQPGLPPIQNKVYQTSPTIESNQVALGAGTFAYRYQYRNYETSTLSGQSTLANYNADGSNYNRIDVSIPFSEKIDQDVIQIDLVYRDLNSDIYSIIFSWRKQIAADAAAINAHNAGTAALTYPFYNNLSGIVLDSAYSVKLFDSAPYLSKTLEGAKNRLFQGNYTIGYDTPTETSLSITASQNTFSPSGGGPIVGEWYLLRFLSSGIPGHPFGTYTYYVLQSTVRIFGTEPLAPIYIYGYSATVVPPYPPSVNSSDLTFLGSTPQAAAYSLIPAPGFTIVLNYTDQSQASVIITGVTPPSSVLSTAFKSDAFYQVSISFKDNYGRESGVLTSPSLLVTTPDTGLSNYTYTTFLTWILNNTNALDEIPEWAYYYSINITKCLKTRFFLQSLGVVIYANKDSSGNYTFTTTAYGSDLAGVAIDISYLNTHGQGYVLNPGDIARLYINGNLYVMSIIDQSAQYIICQLMDVGALSAQTGRYEIYTPYKQQSNEPYFEVSQIYTIDNPGTNTRAYSTLTGFIFGDIYLISRTNSSQGYITEAMNINDKHYQQWFTNSGRPNFIDFIGATNKASSICFSNTFIPGSRNNGLSTFEALNTKDVYPECGPVQKLQLTSKVEGEIGSIMLAVCAKETASMYMGETQVMSASANAFVAQSTDVIGTINVLKGSFGTLNPESVCEFRGNVFWVDIINGKVIQYSANGLFPVSNYKATRFWKLFCAQFISMTQAEIESLGSRPFIFSCVDANNWELLISIPKLLEVPPKGYLPDYPSMIYPFDIWDGQAKTMVYKLNVEPNHWSGSYPFSPEGLLSIQNNIFSFNTAQLYEHNSDIFPCTYYGEPATAKIMCVSNQVPNRPKVYNNTSLEGNLKPTLVYFRTEPSLQEQDRYDLEEQASDLIDFDFEVKEGTLYAAILRNKIQPTSEGIDLNGLLTGNKMRAVTLLILLEFNPEKGPLELRYFNLGYAVSYGHTT